MWKAGFAARDVLDQLDEDARRVAHVFPDLDHPYNYHVDCRLTAYGDEHRWAIVIEQLAVNPRSGSGVGGIANRLYYHGSGVVLPPQPGWRDNPVLTITPLESGSTPLLLPENCQDVDVSATDVRVRGQLVPIRTDANYYWARKIDVHRTTHEWIDEKIAELPANLPARVREHAIANYESMRADVGRFELETWHVLRGLVPDHRGDLLATDAERRRGIPDGLALLLTVDEWDHPRLLDGELPSSCESLKLIAKVLATGDPTAYRPTEPPNTHWSNWPNSGSL